jgi:hypothetical protein
MFYGGFMASSQPAVPTIKVKTKENKGLQPIPPRKPIVKIKK